MKEFKIIHLSANYRVSSDGSGGFLVDSYVLGRSEVDGVGGVGILENILVRRRDGVEAGFVLEYSNGVVVTQVEGLHSYAQDWVGEDDDGEKV